MKKFTGIIFLFVATAQILISVIPAILQRQLVDFTVYHGAVEKFLVGENPYRFLYGAPEQIPFNYPPSALPILLPLSIVSPLISQIILTIFSLFFLWLSLWLTMRCNKKQLSLSHFLIVSAFFTQTFPVKFTLILGQVNLIVLGILMLALYLKNHHRVVSIILFAIALSLKPIPIYFLPLFLVTKEYALFLGVAVLLLIFNLLPGIHLFQEYYTRVLPQLAALSGQPAFYDQSLTAFFMRLSGNPVLAKMFGLLIISLIFLHILIRSKKLLPEKDHFLGFFQLLALSAIASPFSWAHHLVFAYPLIFYLYLHLMIENSLKTENWKLKINAIFLAVWFLLVFHFKNEHSAYLNNPFIASYQTLLILAIILFSIFFPRLLESTKKR